MWWPRKYGTLGYINRSKGAPAREVLTLLGRGPGDTSNSAVASGTGDAHRGPSPAESATLVLDPRRTPEHGENEPYAFLRNTFLSVLGPVFLPP